MSSSVPARAYNRREMLVREFDYELPRELIAQEAPALRGSSRMLALSRATGAWSDTLFANLPDLLDPGDLLVLNQSRVIPARLFAIAAGTRTEVLLTEQTGEWEWKALGRPARKLYPGQKLAFRSAEGAELEAEVIAKGPFGERTLRFTEDGDFFGKLDEIGHVPLPPYIKRADRNDDRERYQTVYATQRGSVAAPTAGLHFTEDILDRIRGRGVETVYLTLHVGLGTFEPVRVGDVESIHLHSERYVLPESTASAINRARREGRRVIAVGTTTVRVLEHCAHSGQSGELGSSAGRTTLFISPGFDFRVVQGLLTNFHLPQSTLLMLVAAFAGREPVLAAYRHAVEAKYRFFSYGDCMLIG